MKALQPLFDNNRAWAAAETGKDADFFNRLADQQAPQYLWIGCADSRVPVNQIVDLPAGEIFVHRNVANVVAADDDNCLSVIHYAVEALQVPHIVVCGHYGCGGVKAALSEQSHGFIDCWVKHIKSVREAEDSRLQAVEEAQQWDALCELNVFAQVENVCRTAAVQSAWEGGQPLAVHGLIYDIKDGQLKDLDIHVESMEQLAALR